jgi:hypothetical protein
MAHYSTWPEAMLAFVGAIMVTFFVIGSVSTAGMLG